MDLLITNARVWDNRPLIDIAIAGERIAAMAPALQVEAARTIDDGGRAVLPGFVEPHLHLEKALIHGRQPTRDGTLEEAIRLTARLKAETAKTSFSALARYSTWPWRTGRWRSGPTRTSIRSRD